MRRLQKAKATGGKPMALKTTHNATLKGTRQYQELQGLSTGRCPAQPAPTWTRPPGADAADLLERCLRAWTLRRRS